jgi:hypothetical protein
LITKDKALLDEGNTKIKNLQDTVKANADTIGKDQADLAAKDDTISSLKNNIQAKDDALAKDQTNLASMDAAIKSLQQTIASYEAQMKAVAEENDAKADEGAILEKIYPKDNGFDSEDLGTGFNALQVFGPVNNPTQVPIPNKIPNRTPWKFGAGNSGIAANGSGFYVTGATNGDSDGATSSAGQAGYLQFKGSSISQSVALPAGTFTVSFDFEGRRDYEPANEIEVSLNGTVLFQGTPTACNNFKRVTSHWINLAKAGKYELMFRGLGANGVDPGDHTTFIDNVVINRIDPKSVGPGKAATTSEPPQPSPKSPIPDIVEALK